MKKPDPIDYSRPFRRRNRELHGTEIWLFVLALLPFALLALWAIFYEFFRWLVPAVG
jgi:hypothetical protein